MAHSIRENTFLDFDVDFTGWSLTDRCVFESNFNECVKCSRGDASFMKFLLKKAQTHAQHDVTFSRYESIIIMIWQNVIEKIEAKNKKFNNGAFCGYYITKGGYIFSTIGLKLVGYSELKGKRYYNLPGKIKKVYDISKGDWIK
jgi:hypothetical protein